MLLILKKRVLKCAQSEQSACGTPRGGLSSCLNGQYASLGGRWDGCKTDFSQFGERNPAKPCVRARSLLEYVTVIPNGRTNALTGTILGRQSSAVRESCGWAAQQTVQPFTSVIQ